MYASAGPAGWRGVVRLVADLGQSSTSDCTRMCVVKNRNSGCYRQKPKRATTQIRVQHTEQGHSYEFNVVGQQQGVPESSKECTRSAHTEQNAGWPRMNLYAPVITFWNPRTTVPVPYQPHLVRPCRVRPCRVVCVCVTFLELEISDFRAGD